MISEETVRAIDAARVFSHLPGITCNDIREFLRRADYPIENLEGDFGDYILNMPGNNFDKAGRPIS